jgi:hypothetical protein
VTCQISSKEFCPPFLSLSLVAPFIAISNELGEAELVGLVKHKVEDPTVLSFWSWNTTVLFSFGD